MGEAVVEMGFIFTRGARAWQTRRVFYVTD